jgi:hypothetical protein
MRYSVQLVNPSFFFLTLQYLSVLRCEGQNYSKAGMISQGPMYSFIYALSDCR